MRVLFQDVLTVIIFLGLGYVLYYFFIIRGNTVEVVFMDGIQCKRNFLSLAWNGTNLSNVTWDEVDQLNFFYELYPLQMPTTQGTIDLSFLLGSEYGISQHMQPTFQHDLTGSAYLPLCLLIFALIFGYFTS